MRGTAPPRLKMRSRKGRKKTGSRSPSRRKSIDGQSIFRLAEAFRGSAQLISQLISLGLSDHFRFPCGVNHAFAMELYLKCLITIETGFTHPTHDLENLFNYLSSHTRKTIERYYDEIRAEDPLCIAFAQWLERHGENPEEHLRLKSALSKSAKAFEVLRYPYEGEEDHNYILGPLEIAARRIILELKPEWNPEVHHPRISPDTPPTSQAR
jgi:hypothetical protein